MAEYTLIYCKAINSNDRVLLTLRKKRDLMYNKLNLIGGTLEENETLEQCALRELKEEAGLEALSKPNFLGKIVGNWGTVHCCKIVVPYELPDPDEDEINVVSWMDWVEVRNDPLLMSNLKVIIPLMMSGVSGWVIDDEGQPITVKFDEETK